MKKTILISAGEASGDLHAARLVKELKALNPHLRFYGMGMKRMSNEGVDMIEQMDEHAIVGVSEVFSKLGFIHKLFKKFKVRIRAEKPDLAILVDYPGFNLILAKILSKHKIPCVYYITPQIWAWGMWRINDIKKTVKKALVILDFEESLYRNNGVDAEFVGHPLLDHKFKIRRSTEARSALGIDTEKFTIALLPGSRDMEIKRLLPLFLRTADLIKRKFDAQFIVSKSPDVNPKAFDTILKNNNIVGAKVAVGNIADCISAADFVITASGTVTLQLAIAGKPMIISYATSLLTYILGKIFVKEPIGLVNIVAKKYLAPEFIQYYADPDMMSKASLDIIGDEKKMRRISSMLRVIRDSLGKPGASKRAAIAINTIL